MTNLESFDAESATAPTTKPESDALNMSAGAEMLIERMKTNPDDFKYAGRFYRVVEAMNAPHGQGWVSERDQEALRSAYGEHIQEAEFSEWVYNEIFNPKEPEPVQNLYAQMQGQRTQMQNAMLRNAAVPLAIQPKGTGAMMTLNANAGNPTMTLGNTTLSESMLTQIKNKLGL